jgi:hypothetical protein
VGSGYGNVGSHAAKYFKHLQEKPAEVFEVGERVEITQGEYEGNEGRIVLRREDKGDYSYGLVFDWDMRMHTVYFTGKDFKRVNT